MSQENKHWLVVQTFRCWPNSLKLACHFMVGFFIYFGLVVAFYLLNPLMVKAETIDIAQTVTSGFWNDPAMRSTILTWHNIGQSFFPRASSLSGIKVMLTRSAGAGETSYYLDLYHGLPTEQASYVSLGTATLSYTSIAESADGNQEANFIFPAPITLIPNDPYFFRLSLASYNLAGVHSRVAWPSQVDGELLAWGALPQADNLQSGYSNLDMYFITYAVDSLAITTTSLPEVTVGALYNQTLTATYGSAPLTWSLSVGALPSGLTLSSAGVISGTPTTPGLASFTVQVNDNIGVTAASSLTINVKAQPNHAPVLSFSSDLGYIEDALEPNLAFKTITTTAFKIVYTDRDNDAPTSVKLMVDNTPYNLTVDANQNGNYVDGEQFVYNLPALDLSLGSHEYYFTASDGKSEVRWPEQGTWQFQVKNVPVVLVPGILGTELKKGDSLLWMNTAKTVLDVGDAFMLPLKMKEDGSADDGEIYYSDVLRGKGYLLGTFHYFDELLTEFKNNNYTEGEDLFVFPYDWRLDNRINALNLKTKIDAILSQTHSSKVDMVAHSMGGLITKQYILNNQDSKINNLIFLGTPHWGAPKALKALLFGDGFGFPGNLLNVKVMKTLAHDMYSVYQLLPNQQLVNNLDGYYYDYTSARGKMSFSYNNTLDMLRVSGYNQSALAMMADFQTNDMANIDLASRGIKSYNIVGCNSATIQAVIKRNHYKLLTNLLGEEIEYNLLMGNGDGTVPLVSALGVTLPPGNTFYANKVAHVSIPSNQHVRRLAVKLINQSFAPADLPTAIKQDDSACHFKGKIVSVHSPVNINVYDNLGNHVGYNNDGILEENISGVTYEELADNKFVFLPEGINYDVRLKGTANGSFNLRVAEVNDGLAASTVYYYQVPVTNLTTATVNFVGTGNVELVVYPDGAGGSSQTITPAAQLTQTESADAVPPLTSVSLDGDLISGREYRSLVSLKLHPVDNTGGSGLFKTVYSLDNGISWLDYHIPLIFNQSGDYTVKYHSLDRAGNWESEKTIEFKIVLPIIGSGSRGEVVNPPLFNFNSLPGNNTGNSMNLNIPPIVIVNSVTNQPEITPIKSKGVESRVAGAETVKTIAISDIIERVKESYGNGGIKRKFISDRLIGQLTWSKWREKYLVQVKKWCEQKTSCLNWVKQKQTRILAAFQYEINIRKGKYINEQDYQLFNLMSNNYLNFIQYE